MRKILEKKSPIHPDNKHLHMLSFYKISNFYGDLTIPITAGKGIYTLRAYTSLMCNFDFSDFFVCVVFTSRYPYEIGLLQLRGHVRPSSHPNTRTALPYK